MPQKTIISKYTKLLLTAIIFAATTLQLNAQKIKIDGVAVVIGKNIVLDSDIAKFKQEIELRSEGKIKITNCEMLEELMQQKLLSHHAVIDSVMVADVEVDQKVDRSIQFFTQEYGSVEKVVAAYGFNDIEDLKSELYNVQKENILVEKEQLKITENVDVTPEEVRLYFNGLKEKRELPEFTAEIELAQIVLNVESTLEENERVVAELTEIRQDVLDGSSFRMKAIINSKDPGVTQNEGKMEVTKESGLIKEFKEVSFSLEKNEISKPFKTLFGYHIIQLHEIKGNTRVVSHILLQPEIPAARLEETQLKVKEIKRDIEAGKITFEEAVKKYSEDKDSKNNAGVLINEYTGDTKFDLTRMDPAMYARVNDLSQGGYTDVFYDELRGGKKMYKFILMKERTDTHIADLVDDYVKVQILALKKKKEETIEKWSRNKIKDTYIKLGADYKKCSFNKNWKKVISK